MIILHQPKDIIPYFVDIMNSDTPIFVNRIGGSDFEAVCQYFNNKSAIEDDNWYNHQVQRVRDLNGYFDENNSKEVFTDYLEIMISSYLESDVISYAGKISNQFAKIKDMRARDFKSQPGPLIRAMAEGKYCIHWNSFFEDTKPFLETFKIWGEGKKILIISPLDKSVRHQYLNKNNLFYDYQFPEFDLITYKTSITYSLGSDNKETLGVQTSNWVEESKKMCEEISKLDFDIALLSCGSYAMPLGHFIKSKLFKKSIYIGGPLNLYFNIYGERYKDRYSDLGINLNYQIDAFENSEIEKMQGGKNYYGESLNAYFGVRKNHAE